MEIVNCLNKYSSGYYEDMFGSFDIDTIDSFRRATKFLSDFALNADCYQQECVPRMRNVFKPIGVDEFNIYTSPISMLFQPDFETTLHISSPMFTEETYNLFQKICQECNDHFFYIVEDSDEDTAFQLKIPVTTSWEQLLSGGFISTVLFKMPYNNYRLFGDSCSWGKWCDYENSWADYEIFGCKLDIPEVINYNQEQALSVDDYLHIKNNIGFPKNIQIRTDAVLPNHMQEDNRDEIKYKYERLALYVK